MENVNKQGNVTLKAYESCPQSKKSAYVADSRIWQEPVSTPQPVEKAQPKQQG